MKPYITVAEESQSEIVIKRSRFIATIAPVKDYDSAMQFVADIKSRYNDATHNCYAFISDSKGLEFKFGDDGEPQGTAGMPILEVLKKNEIYTTAIVVTRYFGGVKLGANGLVGAYSASAVSAINNAEKVKMLYSDWLIIDTDYSAKGKIDSVIFRLGGVVVESQYNNTVKINLIIPKDKTEEFVGMIADITSGKGVINITKSGYYPY